MTTPTQRTLKALKDSGALAAVVEHWNAWARVRQDLWGFGDVLACWPDRGGPPLIVQATTMDNRAARVAKVLAEPTVPLALRGGFAVEVWAWRKLVKSGRWEVARTVFAWNGTEVVADER